MLRFVLTFTLIASLAMSCGDNSSPSMLIDISEEPAGSNCAAGGQRIDYGVDDNGDGVLDPDEIDVTSFVCDGTDGGSGSLVTVTSEPPGANCANGGERIDYGIDDDGDGILDADEIDGTTYVCDGDDGDDGANGTSALVAITAEPAGANCADGGQRIDYGMDDDADGVLDTEEIDGTSYACNGADGADGLQSLVDVTAEPAGANCANGGQRIDRGIDDNGDGVLDAGEIDETSYVCDGADGLQTLVSVTAEPAGANCADGGQRIDHGVDDDGDGILDAGEIDGTSYACNGADGADGLQSLIDISDLAPGAICAFGGIQIDHGLDDDQDGVLDPSEIDGTAYVCHADDGSERLFSASGVFTVPPGVTSVRVLVVGGGGGGANGHQGGGGSGIVATGAFVVTPGQEITVTIGAGGLGALECVGCNTIAGNTAGGASSFGALLSAAGGATPTVINGPAATAAAAAAGRATRVTPVAPEARTARTAPPAATSGAPARAASRRASSCSTVTTSRRAPAASAAPRRTPPVVVAAACGSTAAARAAATARRRGAAGAALDTAAAAVVAATTAPRAASAKPAATAPRASSTWSGEGRGPRASVTPELSAVGRGARASI